jgi:hypothetical protein
MYGLIVLGVWNWSSDKVSLLLGFGPLRRDPAALGAHRALRKLKVRKFFNYLILRVLQDDVPRQLWLSGSRFYSGHSTSKEVKRR